MSFNYLLRQYKWDKIQEDIYKKTAKDVEKALLSKQKDLEDFKCLLSPAAKPYLRIMADMSHQLTKKRFGKTILLFAPLYLSNECQNICTYCGFSFHNKIERKTLTGSEILKEINVLKNLHFDHVLLVTGEANQKVGMPYFLQALSLISPHFSSVLMEVQPLETIDYIALRKASVNSILAYQETYHPEVYAQYHTKGKKANYLYRLNTPDRIGDAHIHKMGLGVLLGLTDWRTDSFFLALHLSYLEKKYWQSKFSISFPRIRPHEGELNTTQTLKQSDLIQLICSFRLFNEEVELTLSTRENALLRDHLFPLGITSMSAGSKTNPGGYAMDTTSLEQFSIDDNRSPMEVASSIASKGYEPIWKDWDRSMTTI